MFSTFQMFLSYTLHFGLTGAQREFAAFKGKTGSFISALCRETVWFVQKPTPLVIGGTFSISGYVKSWMSVCSQKSMPKLRNFKVCHAARNATLLPQMGHRLISMMVFIQQILMLETSQLKPVEVFECLKLTTCIFIMKHFGKVEA